MTALSIFRYDGADVRMIERDGEPWWVVADICRVLGIGKANDAARGLDDDERGTDTIRTPSGEQSMLVCSEAGLYSLILRSRKPEAREFKRWITHEVLPRIRRAGEYRTAPAVEVSRRDLALAVLAAEDEADRQRARAEVAEQFKAAIESNEGRSIRAFHKHYFADTPEREFFEALYASGLLIDQRRKGTRRTDGTYRNGSQHNHPSHTGKQFFYIDAGIAEHNGHRFEQSRVRPGDPEVALVTYLSRRGLEATRAALKEIAHA